MPFMQDEDSMRSQKERSSVPVPISLSGMSKAQKAALAAYMELLKEVEEKGTKIMQGLEILSEKVRGCGRCDITFHYLSPALP